MDSCIFCKIGRRDIPVPAVYEDEAHIAFVDLHPLNPGHTLVIPKAHAETIIDLTDEGFAELMRVARTVSKRVHKAFPSPRLGFLVKGFDVPHVHLHIIPQHSISDIVSGKYGAHLPPEASLENRTAMAERIKNA